METKKLPMSTYDITKMYKEAKDKRAQIDILADMNCCTTKQIREELIKGGITFQTLPRKSRKEKYTVKFDPVKGVAPVLPGVSNDEPKEEPKKEPKDIKLVNAPKLTFRDIPEAVYKAVENEIAVVTKQIKEVEEVLKNAYANLSDLESFLANFRKKKD